MIPKNKFYLIISILLFLIFLGKSFISNFLAKTALVFSPDKSIKLDTVDILYYLFILSVFILIVILYLKNYTGTLKSQENRTILAAIILEYSIILFIFIFKYKLLKDPIYNAFAFINTFQLLLAGLISYFISKIYKTEIKKRLLWATFSLGFFYFSIDEFFEIHEYIGDQVLYPIVQNTFFGRFISRVFHDPNDIIISTYFLLGLIFIFIFFNVVKECLKNNKKFFILVILALLSMAFQIPSEKYQFYFMEETFEIFSSMFFALAFYLLYKSLKHENDKKQKI